ncbi:hypothetical protein I1A62_29905 [Rhodococcus sp. USK10]|uniref:hypothetical protein n=1 Tax=Rhodococcus sp. USK10 TaxID=2789739 RepID=UPI001C5FB067|nr:hypothetical protein [Rhodococcus sp. USK10]QYB01449.1 hypothetical protein I1A62_29905 [Rhodococcus sp. USK10]
MSNEPKETPAVRKLWTYGDADKYEITVDVPADVSTPPVTMTLPPTICSDEDDAEIDLTWVQAMQLRSSLNDLFRWIHGEGLDG